MSKVLVLYYSAYGHIEAMANAVAEGARQAGAHVDIKRVPELVPEEIARKSHYKLDRAALRSHRRVHRRRSLCPACLKDRGWNCSVEGSNWKRSEGRRAVASHPSSFRG